MARTLRAFVSLQNKTLTYAAETAAKNTTFTTTVSVTGGVTPAYGTSTYFPNVLKVDNQTDKPIALKASLSADATAAVFATDLQIKNGTSVTIDVGQYDYISIIPSASATGSVYFARGLGGL